MNDFLRGIKYILFIYILFFPNWLIAGSCIFQNKFVKASVSKDGTFGAGVRNNGETKLDPPGIIFDPSGEALFNVDNDYLTSEGIPFEFFAVKIDDDIYANDNSDGYKKRKRGNRRKNKGKLPSKIECFSQDEGKVITKIDHLLEVEHFFKLQGKNITISVTLTNISSKKLDSVQYARGIDVDPGEIQTINRRGVDQISPKDIVYTKGKTNGLPLAIYSNDITKHNVTVLKFNNGYGCIYDPSVLLQGKMEISEGDGVIYIAFDIGSLGVDESKTFTFHYIMGRNVQEVKKNIEKSQMKVSNSKIKIPYTNSREYKFFNEIKLGIYSKDKKRQQERYKVNFKLLEVPEGILLRIGENNLTKESPVTTVPISIHLQKGVAEVNLALYRNFKFNEDEKFDIKFQISDINKKIKFENDGILTLDFIPESRKLKLIISPNFFEVPLDELEKLEYISVEVKDEAGNNLTREELESIDLELDMEGVNYRFEKNIDTLQYKIYIKPEIPLCLTKVGNVKGKIKVVDGFFPNDYGEAQILGKIEDISLWEKCKAAVYTLLSVLFSLWYLIGMIKKPRFDKKKYLEIKRFDENGNEISYKKSYFKKIPFYQKLIPYTPESIVVKGLKILAARGGVIKIHTCQKSLKINGVKVEYSGTYKNCMVYTGTSIIKATKGGGETVITYK